MFMQTFRRISRLILLPGLALGLGVLAPLSFSPSPVLVGQALGQNPTAPLELSGTYKIESWKNREQSHLFHFFYLNKDGTFLLGAEWPGFETTRIAGNWKAEGDNLMLTGHASVKTNKGEWQAEFHRAFHISTAGQQAKLTPVPEKNRFGMLGWPDSFIRSSPKPEPNLPSGEIPADEAGIVKLTAKYRM
ncbi:MAG: hypothetical protein OEW12_00440 [Deltaproteobacteria bacterium]|nr:hypothetical protein [Deltaproteobacteria bacterium]